MIINVEDISKEVSSMKRGAEMKSIPQNLSQLKRPLSHNFEKDF